MQFSELQIRQPLLAESESAVFELRPQLSWMHYERLMRVDDKQKCTAGDHPTVGLILCSDTSEYMAQYSILNDNKHIYQAKYLNLLGDVS